LRQAVVPSQYLQIALDLATRIAQGWRFGPERNDARKEHPCLIPYEELPEEERTYDRQTALETLKLIEHLGFEIRKR